MAQAIESEKLTPSLDLIPMAYAHLDEVLEIEREAFSNPWRRSDFEYALGKSNGHAVVAFQSDLMVGYVVGFFVRGEFHLASLAVRGDLRGRGIGKMLLSRITEGVKSQGARVITLEVRASNSRALALYGKAGFRRAAIREDYYTHPREDAFVMIKVLHDNAWPSSGPGHSA